MDKCSSSNGNEDGEIKDLPPDHELCREENKCMFR